MVRIPMAGRLRSSHEACQADLPAALEAVAGTEWYIVEYESDGYPRMEAVRCWIFHA